MASNEQIEAVTDAMLEAVSESAERNGCDPADIMCAMMGMAVKFSLACAKSPEDARSVIDRLADDYFEQAQHIDAGGLQ